MTTKDTLKVMNQKLGPLQKKWIKALRSGKFKQNKDGYLCLSFDGKEHHCCLGVAEEICGAKKEMTGINGHKRFNGETAVLSSKTQRKMKFRQKNGTFSDGFIFLNEISLADVNDNTKAGFKTIASFVEKHPEAVFTGPA